MAASSETLKKVQDLVGLALNEGAAEGEARNAAVEALRLIKSENLVLVSKEDFDRVAQQVQGARQEAQKARSSANSRVVVGLLIGLVAAKKFKL
jgi:hypothetical protein